MDGAGIYSIYRWTMEYEASHVLENIEIDLLHTCTISCMPRLDGSFTIQDWLSSRQTFGLKPLPMTFRRDPSRKSQLSCEANGGFHSPQWMVCQGRSYSNGWFASTPIYGFHARNLRVPPFMASTPGLGMICHVASWAMELGDPSAVTHPAVVRWTSWNLAELR